MARRCEKCSVCCIHMPIPAGIVAARAKPAAQRCPHLGGAGCRRYARRPQVCGDFACAWLSDAAWPEVWRPDLSGLLCLREDLAAGLPAAAVYEIRPHSLLSPIGEAIVAELRRTTAVLALIDWRKHRTRLDGAIASVPPPQTPKRPAA